MPAPSSSTGAPEIEVAECGCDAGTTSRIAAEAPIACTLGAEDVDQRLADWHETVAVALTHVVTPTGVQLTFQPSPVLAARLATLAAAETHCCAFFRMRLTLAADELTLDIACPPAAMPILEALLRADEQLG